MKRKSKGAGGRNYKRGKRVQIFVHQPDGKSIGSFRAIFWEGDSTYLYHRETYRGQTEKIRWSEVDNVVPLAQREAVGLEPKGQEVRSAVQSEVSAEAKRITEINAAAPVTTLPKRAPYRKMTAEEIVFMLDEIVEGTPSGDIREVLERGGRTVAIWKNRVSGKDADFVAGSSLFERQFTEVQDWFRAYWSKPAEDWELRPEPKKEEPVTKAKKLSVLAKALQQRIDETAEALLENSIAKGKLEIETQRLTERQDAYNDMLELELKQ
tara:strand:+ start:306 stop:1106 length:801 start_codon:yes stop_codon:yes gene_type:complete